MIELVKWFSFSNSFRTVMVSRSMEVCRDRSFELVRTLPIVVPRLKTNWGNSLEKEDLRLAEELISVVHSDEIEVLRWGSNAL